MLYYLDTCIWLNGLKKESIISRNKTVAQWTDLLIAQCEDNNEVILVSPMIIRELAYKLGKETSNIKEELRRKSFIKFVKAKSEDYAMARMLENSDDESISFYDYLHLSIAFRFKAILVTRDKDLIQRASKWLEVSLPEDLVKKSV